MDPNFDRTQGIGASDAKAIMDGNWHQLWCEKTKREPGPDLSGIFPVQLGRHTERFHVEWIARQNGWQVEFPERPLRCVDTPFLYTHLDAFIAGAAPSRHIEVKHCNGRATVRERAVYYMAQLQHAMHVLATDSCIFSIIAGNDEPSFIEVERNDEYIKILLDREKDFWWHVTNDVEPMIAPAPDTREVKQALDRTRIGGLVRYDMRQNNRWPILARQYASTVEFATKNAQALKELKELVPADAAEASDDMVSVKRDKAGRLRVTVIGKEDADDAASA